MTSQNNILKFSDLHFEDQTFIGAGLVLPMFRARVQFPNGYGLSIVKGHATYGGDKGLYEAAVLKDDQITYDTTITDDVLGYQSEDDITELLKKVSEL